jgi:hypothetical protein
MPATSTTFDWTVEFTPVGEAPFVMKVRSQGTAILNAVEQLKSGSTGVVIKHLGTVDNDALKIAREKIGGKGHAVARANLIQLQEYTALLKNQAGTTKPFIDDDVRVWLEMVFHSCKAIGVTPLAIDKARHLAYGGAVPQTQPQKELAKP